MDDITVQQLAERIGESPEGLIALCQEAGLSHQNSDDAVSTYDKKVLLDHLISKNPVDRKELGKIIIGPSRRRAPDSR